MTSPNPNPKPPNLSPKAALKLLTTSPINVLNEAVRAVPALKYVLGVLGIVAAIAIARGFVSSARVAVIGTLIVLVLMVAVVIFAALTRATGALRIAATIMMFSFLILTIATISFIFTSVFFKWPLDLHRWIVDEHPIIVPTPTPTPTPMPTPGDSATINLLEGRFLESTIKDMARIDNSRAIIRNCSTTFMKSKIRGGVVRARDIRGLIEVLQYRIDNPETSEKYAVTRKEHEQTYEIQCSNK
jgi:hypothetical protein